MPRARAYPRIASALLAVALTACAGVEFTRREDLGRMPRQIRMGMAEMVILRVQDDVSRDEVAEAVRTMVAEAPICLPWPSLWLNAMDNRRTVYVARYDLMARDWGQDVADASEGRMREFVELGFLTSEGRPDIGSRVIEYTLTPDGASYLRGSPYGGDRPQFCAPQQRRLVDITEMQWGEFPCGSLRVRFTHVADGWPGWARTESVRTRIAQAAWAPIGQVTEGSVTLGRQWFRDPPQGVRNGSLRSVCYDRARQVVTGDDLALSPAPSSP